MTISELPWKKSAKAAAAFVARCAPLGEEVVALDAGPSSGIGDRSGDLLGELAPSLVGEAWRGDVDCLRDKTEDARLSIGASFEALDSSRDEGRSIAGGDGGGVISP